MRNWFNLKSNAGNDIWLTRKIHSRENMLVIILSILGFIWLTALTVDSIQKYRSLPPSVQICKNLVEAKMIDESECMKSEPRAAPRYVNFYFIENKATDEFVRTGMKGFEIYDESSGNCYKSSANCSSVEYLITDRIVWDETMYFGFENGVLKHITWHD